VNAPVPDRRMFYGLTDAQFVPLALVGIGLAFLSILGLFAGRQWWWASAATGGASLVLLVVTVVVDARLARRNRERGPSVRCEEGDR
jgi:hypothetical protein